MSQRLRVFLAGSTSDDLESLRKRARGDAGLEVAGAALLSELHRGQANVPGEVDAVLMTAAAFAREHAATTTAARDAEPPDLIEALTAREHDVLALVADGCANREIAGRLGISEHTVKFHLSSIFGKLGASTRTEAVRRALELGLIAI